MPKKKAPDPRSPQQQRAKFTLRSILAGAEKVLTKEGYEGATTNKIAEIAGVSIGSLYQYFRSKEDVVAALIDRVCQQIESRHRAAIEENAHKDLAGLVTALIRIMLEEHLPKRTLFRVLFQQTPRVGKLARRDETLQQIIDMVHMLLISRQDLTSTPDPRFSAYMLVHAVDGVIQGLVKKKASEVDIDSAVFHVSTMVLSYLASVQEPNTTSLAGDL